LAVSWRPAKKDDRAALEHFRCTEGGQPEYEREVQTWIRRDAIRDTNRSATKWDQRLLLVYDGDDLIAVGCHSRWGNIDGQPSRLWLVGAVALEYQGKRLSTGQRASEALVEVVVNDILDRDDPPPAWLAGKVHKDNVRSLGLCDRIGLSTRQPLSGDLVLCLGPLPSTGLPSSEVVTDA
jgi:hypothetical protein